jgi:hypothetical protein
VSHAALIARIEAEADALTDRVLADMLRNPFWRERFGERADKHGRQDGKFHLQYLVQALAADEAMVIEQYARWLQQVLTTRGMCSRHLAENFDKLAEQIAAWPAGSPAVALLHAATQALYYPDSTAARRLQDRANTYASLAASELHARHPEWTNRSRCEDDLRYHLSYAADALALADAQAFARYVAWIRDFLERRGISRDHLYESLDVLATLAEREVPELRGLVAGTH